MLYAAISPTNTAGISKISSGIGWLIEEVTILLNGTVHNMPFVCSNCSLFLNQIPQTVPKESP